MKFLSFRKNLRQPTGIDGVLPVIAAVPIIFANLDTLHAKTSLTLATAFSAMLFLISAGLILKFPRVGKFLAVSAAILCLAALSPVLQVNPTATLIAAVVFILGLNFLFDFKPAHFYGRASDSLERDLQKARSAAGAVFLLSVIRFFVIEKSFLTSEIALWAAAVLAQVFSIIWSIRQPANFHKMFCIVANALTFFTTWFLLQYHLIWAGTLLASLILLLMLPESSDRLEQQPGILEPMLSHPGRITFVTFLFLCIIGTFLLSLPGATVSSISLIDAAFTSVSAVCVTGLIVLDTPNDFSFMGQLFILILIQLGGLGIMTITTVAMHAMGRRLSMKQERLLNSAYNSDYKSLGDSLVLIVKFTAIAEIAGAVVLGLLFHNSGSETFQAVWKGIFTSVSAFCNAGFALQSDSLIQYQKSPAILHSVAVLIVIGGLAPAVALLIPRWARGKKVHAAEHVALTTTAILLLVGTIFILAFEWNGILAGLSLSEKLHNAWFQSVTLRTAGFNSVGLETIVGPTFLLMICLMFIGGSPGGTAGGVKTTTFGMLAITFWSCAAGYEDISVQNRRILPQTVFKAVTITMAGLFLLFTIIIMLEATQNINARDLIFEAASALGTVGLSTGATASLDSIGKIIIIFAMFAGRIGPITLFTLLSRDHAGNGENLLEARINLT